MSQIVAGQGELGRMLTPTQSFVLVWCPTHTVATTQQFFVRTKENYPSLRYYACVRNELLPFVKPVE